MNDIKKRFADFLEFRKSEINIEDLEKQYNCLLPPIYRSFVSTFEDVLGDVYITQKEELKTLTYFRYKSATLSFEEILLEDFMKIEAVFECHRNNDFWIENEVFPITLHSHGGGIVVGAGSSNLDQLFFEHDSGLVWIEENIFSLIKNLEFVQIPDINFKSVYKIWGEDYWRLK